MSNLVLTLERLGKYDEAEQMQQQAFELKKKMFGREHSEILVSMSGLAVVLERLGRYDKAEQMQRQVFELYTKVLGREYPYMSASRCNDRHSS